MRPVEPVAPEPAKNSGSLFSRIVTPKPKPAPAEETTAEAPKKEGMMAKVSRTIGLRGSEKKEQSAEAQPAAPSAIRPTDTRTATEPARADNDRLDRQPDERRAAYPVRVELRQPLAAFR